jgi:hypothetical protein
LPNSSRRAILRGLAVVPLAAVPAAASALASPAPDPVFAALEAYRAIKAEADAACAATTFFEKHHPAVVFGPRVMVRVLGKTYTARDAEGLERWLASLSPKHTAATKRAFARALADLADCPVPPRRDISADDLARWRTEARRARRRFKAARHARDREAHAIGYDAARARQEATEAALIAAEGRVFSTTPTTSAGALALVQFMREHLASFGGDGALSASIDVFENLAAFLTRDAAFLTRDMEADMAAPHFIPKPGEEHFAAPKPHPQPWWQPPSCAPLAPAERLALRYICEHADTLAVKGATFLLIPAPADLLDALSAFEADLAEIEDNIDAEAEIDEPDLGAIGADEYADQSFWSAGACDDVEMQAD